ncbi:MAG: DUF2202 domain-containing protein [Flavobacteriia bacterium]|nr:DUF2202 domain-containing protein [Flavobacteriia bacterium]
MKTPIKILTLILPLLFITSCKDEVIPDDNPAPNPRIETGSPHLDSIINDTPYETLSNEEVDAIYQMREEEKLARDLYATAADTFGLFIFNNISASEQKHMRAMWALIEKYDLNDPVVDDSRGAFSTTEFQQLYSELLPSFSTHLDSALLKGSFIEELDIHDLRNLKEITDNVDMTMIFDNLERGSRNHLRGFHDQQVQRGLTYTPVFLSQAEYDSIVNSPKEH